MKNLAQKNILLGICGGIAAYKAAELVRLLKKAGANVRVIMTDGAKAFITPLTLQALSGERVHDNLLDADAEAGMGHIELARWADCIVIAPATANTLAALAHGQAEQLLTAVCLASDARKAIAPAMNQQMWHDPAVQANLTTLHERGFLQWGPAEGEQACGDVGPGRLLAPEAIAAALDASFDANLLAGKHVVITAGPTREAIDPVRFLTNHSSGKMGYALAAAAREAGARVTLISGPTALTPPAHIDIIQITSAVEMHQQLLEHIDAADIFIACAAVADYRPDQTHTHKIKKSAETLSLTLVRNPDIILSVTQREHKPFIVGFAAESEHVIVHAQEKLVHKQMDMIIANQIGVEHSGFASDDNTVTVITADKQQALPTQRKSALARELIRMIATQEAKRHE